jgi:chemotaxis protein CheZ
MVAGRRVAAATAHEPSALRALADRRDEAIDATMQGLENELVVLRETMACNRNDLAALVGERKDRRMARAAGELGAAIDAMEKATKTILDATEGIDDSAKSLGSVLKNEYGRGLAQDIQEHAVKIYEACNFQDLAGQRIAKVIATLALVEEQVAAVLDRCGGKVAATETPAGGSSLVNGPKLDGDSGHANQGDIDALFGERVSRDAGSR